MARYARPLLDFSRGIGGLPLICSQLPLTTPGLQLALIEAHSKRLLLPAATQSVIRIEEATYPAIKTMSVDISGAQVRPDYRPAEFKKPVISDRVLKIKNFDYRAWPVRFATAEGFLRIRAEDVSMALLQENGQSCLVLSDARDGEMEIAFSIDDLRTALLSAARQHAGKVGFTVKDLTVSLSLESENQALATMDVWGNWLVFPGHVRFTGRVRLDDAFHAHVTDLAVKGVDFGGKAMASVIDGKLRKTNGKVVPLVRFPGNRIQLRDVHMNVDDKWRLNARFGEAGLMTAK